MKFTVCFALRREFCLFSCLFFLAIKPNTRDSRRHICSSSQSDHGSRSWISASILLRVGYLEISRKIILLLKTVVCAFSTKVGK